MEFEWLSPSAKELFDILRAEIDKYMTPPIWVRDNESYYRWHDEAYRATDYLRKQALHLLYTCTNINITVPKQIIIVGDKNDDNRPCEENR